MALKSIVILLFCMFCACKQPFEVLKSTSQHFYGGQRDSGGGINYSVKLVTEQSSKNLNFNYIIVDGESLKIKMQNTNNQFIKEFNKGDTLHLFSTFSICQENLADVKPGTDTPSLVYTCKSKQEKIEFRPEQLSRLAYP